ncbi:methyl-accepting chemotaxis protein [Burkholderia ubonensis]|uniref:methyl-accepting chemotaxis protein n=1 Tax=Burkholderia ubonensis TaxID=101571 RepID=UPI002ABD9E02|nr:methyl-accepting chemotaxis protein [Burkholderia ubonensis]
MNNISVRFTITAVIAIFTLLVVSCLIAGIVLLTRSNESTDFVHDTSGRVILINDVYKDSARTRAGFALAYAGLMKGTKAEPWVFDNIKTTRDRMLSKLQEFNSLPILPTDDEALRAELIDSANSLARLLDQGQQLLKSSDADGYYALNIDKIDKAGGRFSKALERYQKVEKDNITQTQSARRQEFQTMRWVVWVSICIALVLAAAVLYLLRTVVTKPLDYAVTQLGLVAQCNLAADIQITSNNEIGKLLTVLRGMQQSLGSTVRGIQTNAESVTVASQEIASGNTDLSGRTEEQAASLEETAASMTQLTETVKQNADNARQANTLASRATNMADAGNEAVQEMAKTIGQINGSSTKISEITGVIEGIAFQTNILALNAAVEAARAGEQGRGFAVVASEVRSLAQRSASAAKEIKELIGSSVSMIQGGAKQAAQVGTTMGEVKQAIKQVSDIVGEIAAASEEQSRGIEQVNQAVSQMDEVTQQNAALVEQVAAAAHSLEEQANNLKEAVSVFKVADTTTRRVSSAVAAGPRASMCSSAMGSFGAIA